MKQYFLALSFLIVNPVIICDNTTECDNFVAPDIKNDDPFIQGMDFDRIEDFIEGHHDDFVLEPPSKVMVFLRKLGTPIIMAYFDTKERIQRFFSWCAARFHGKKKLSKYSLTKKRHGTCRHRAA